MMWTFLSLAAFVGVAAAAGLVSPCPGRFDYDKELEPGHWEGTLTLLTDYKLNGLWIRVFFDRAVKKLELLDHKIGEVKASESPKEFLIKNRDVVLKKDAPLKVKFTVSYEGNTPPALMGYRLNARDICPEGQD